MAKGIFVRKNHDEGDAKFYINVTAVKQPKVDHRGIVPPGFCSGGTNHDESHSDCCFPLHDLLRRVICDCTVKHLGFGSNRSTAWRFC